MLVPGATDRRVATVTVSTAPPAGPRPKLIRRLSLFGTRNRPPHQPSGMRMLPRHLLARGRFGQRA